MTISQIVVTVIGIFLILFIYWFFFMAKSVIKQASRKQSIIVRGGYSPSTIRAKFGEPLSITFIRKDDNSCLEEIIFPDFRIKEYLPMNQPVTIDLNPQIKGIYNFHCGMNMFHGKVEFV